MYNIRSFAIRLIAILVAFSLHEMAHAVASYWLGDRSQRYYGRMTFNPLAHIDWVGLLCLLAFGFGWGKPVSVDPRNYKDPKSGMVWTAFAGPFINFVLSFVCVFLFYFVYKFVPFFAHSSIGDFFMDIFAQTAYISAGLGIFNCIPIPPLDGSKILFSVLPDEQYFKAISGSQIFSFLFIILFVSGVFTQPIITLEGNLIELFTNICTTVLQL